MDIIISSDLNGAAFLGWWIVANILVVAVAISVVHVCERLVDWWRR